MTPQEILQEALKLPLSEQESIANELAYHVLGELQSLGLEEACKGPPTQHFDRPTQSPPV